MAGERQLRGGLRRGAGPPGPPGCWDAGVCTTFRLSRSRISIHFMVYSWFILVVEIYLLQWLRSMIVRSTLMNWRCKLPRRSRISELWSLVYNVADLLEGSKTWCWHMQPTLSLGLWQVKFEWKLVLFGFFRLMILMILSFLFQPVNRQWFLTVTAWQLWLCTLDVFLLEVSLADSMTLSWSFLKLHLFFVWRDCSHAHNRLYQTSSNDPWRWSWIVPWPWVVLCCFATSRDTVNYVLGAVQPSIRPGNAKGVNKKVEKKLMGIVGPLRTFVCCCEEDAEHALKKAKSIWGDDVGDG